IASSIACNTTDLSIDLSRATASAICKSSVLLAAMAAMSFVSFSSLRFAGFQILLNQCVRQYELGFGDGTKCKGLACSVHVHHHVVALQPQKLAPEALAAA